MKIIIRILLLIAVARFSGPVFSSDNVGIYQGLRSEALLLYSNNENILMISGGAIPRGAATAGDFFVKSHIKLKKRPNYYEGNLDPVSNEIVEIDNDKIYNNGLGVYLYPQKIRIGGVQATGICADGIDLSGEYQKTKKSSDSYRRIFLRFMNLSHENANFIFGKGNMRGAIAELRPFIENYNDEWITDKNSAAILIPAVNDYAFFLQGAGRNSDALIFLQIVIKYAPDRAVAWLNIADVYWVEKNMENARYSYNRYIRIMRSNAMAEKIPRRALERANSP
jgi:hypothetical protein